jgi:site-specific DNA-methyltransferase (adenine-specific)
MEFGFKVPIVIDRNYVIVCGHTRYKAAKEIGLKEVPCIMADDLTEDQINAFRLADNKTQELAEWDWNKIGIELDSITGIDMSLMGFEDFLDKSDPGELPEKKLGGGAEIDLDSFGDNEFTYVCPCCGFRFNER